MKTGVVLSGGGAKGFFQVQALLELKRLGVIADPDFCVGSSVGALNAAGWAYSGLEALKTTWMHIRSRRDVFEFASFGINPKGIYSHAPLKKMIDLLVSGRPKFEAVACVASLKTRRPYFASNFAMPLSRFKYFTLSSALIPFWNEPENEKELFFDGGLKNVIPLDYALDLADRLIVITTTPVDFERNPDNWEPSWPLIFSYGFRAIDDVIVHDVSENDLKVCQSRASGKEIIVIDPKEPLGIGTHEFDPFKIRHSGEMAIKRIAELYPNGYNEG